MTLWFEDIESGTSWDLGRHTFTEDEIIAFAQKYDPQYFHIDPEAAKEGPFGGLVASGWHTVSMGHKVMVDYLYTHDDMMRARGEEPGVSGPSPGVNKMVFKAPVRPGDEIHFKVTVRNKRKSQSLPGWGVLLNVIEAHNQNAELVYHSEIASFSKLRDYKPTLKVRILLAMAAMPVIGKIITRK